MFKYVFLIMSSILSASAYADRPPDRCHEKVDVCHKNRHTINIDQHAVQAHLDHGDSLGECLPEPECELNEDCMDNVFCNGAEVCVDGVCGPAANGPCDETEICLELQGCVPVPECTVDADCSDSLFCNGEEVCSEGTCGNGSSPCETNLCSEDLDLCVAPPECLVDEDCSDSLFCTGHEVCVDGECGDSISRCHLGELCDEEADGCFIPSEGEGEGEGEGEPVGEGEGELPGEGEGEGEVEQPSEGEGEDPGQPSRSPNEDRNISGSSIFACSQNDSTGFIMFALIPVIIAFRRKLVAATAIFALLAASASEAESLTGTTGLVSNQDTVHTISPDTISSESMQLNVSLDYANAPVTFRDESFRLLSNAIDNQATLKIATAIGLTEDIQMDMAVPLSIAGGLGIASGRNLSAGLTDSTIGFRLALNPISPEAQVALTLHSTVPSSFLAVNGQPEFGESLPTIVPGVSVRLGKESVKTLVNISYTARMPKQVADLRIGHSLNLSAAMLADIVDNRLAGFVESRTSVSGYPLGSSRTIIPLEVGAGLRFQEGNLFGVASAGTGLLADVGVPLFRADVSIGTTFDFAKHEAPSRPIAATVTEEVTAPPAAPPAKVNESPLAFVLGDEIVILQPVQFYFDSDQIKPESVSILTEVGNVLKSHPEIKIVSVQGHTSSEGTSKYNLSLSERRCLAVVKNLRDQGVLTALEAVGFGETNPKVSNKTKAGRETNRRVEFKIKE